MLVCIKRWKEPVDIQSMILEECTKETIKTALTSGIQIYGLMLKNNSKLMSYTTEYRYCNGENLHIGVYEIKVVATQALVFSERANLCI